MAPKSGDITSFCAVRRGLIGKGEYKCRSRQYRRARHRFLSCKAWPRSRRTTMTVTKQMASILPTKKPRKRRKPCRPNRRGIPILVGSSIRPPETIAEAGAICLPPRDYFRDAVGLHISCCPGAPVPLEAGPRAAFPDDCVLTKRGALTCLNAASSATTILRVTPMVGLIPVGRGSGGKDARHAALSACDSCVDTS